MMTRIVLGGLAVLAWAQVGWAQEGAWTPLFDGQSLKGWKAAENPASFQVKDGAIVAVGPRAHLFYVGDGQANFKNFELQAEVMTKPGANSGVFFHTAFQDKDWPDQGFEVQVNNSQPRQGNYLEMKKTGSLYGVRDQYKAVVRDNEWFQLRVTVRGNHVLIWVNDQQLVDYVEPAEAVPPTKGKHRRLSSGTFALQAHDPASEARFKNLRVKRLPDDAHDNVTPPVVDDTYRQILALQDANFPMVNSHVHLKGGLTLEEALATSRATGIGYGIAVNCGLKFAVTNDAGIEAYLASMKNQPAYVAMQAEGREWVHMFSKEAIAKFDYVFTDSMTISDDEGHRMRLWIKDEVVVGDKQKFMDTLVNRAVGILNTEPIDIYVNPTFLPDVIASEYDTLWTEARMRQVIDAAVKHGVAIEINARYRLPSEKFIKMAKAAGAKFSFGTNNPENQIGDLNYCLQMVKACGLTWEDMFVPKPDGQKPVQVKR